MHFVQVFVLVMFAYFLFVLKDVPLNIRLLIGLNCYQLQVCLSMCDLFLTTRDLALMG